MMMTDLTRDDIPDAVLAEIRECDGCEADRTPRAFVCQYHEGWWDGYEHLRAELDEAVVATCPAKIRLMPDNPATEVRCERTHPAHQTESHRGVLRDYAHPGSTTAIEWLPDDRRSFDGEWPGLCGREYGCRLPSGHPRGCAV